MDAQEYTAEDFALNAQFQQWVLNANAGQRASWNTPVQRETIDRAIGLIQQAGLTKDTDANEAFLHVWNNIRTQIHDTSKVSS